jgi:hypothetical protein
MGLMIDLFKIMQYDECFEKKISKIIFFGSWISEICHGGFQQPISNA